jgi:hypothetical protein
MDAYLQENTERLQASRFAGLYLSCSKVCVGFKSLNDVPDRPLLLLCSLGTRQAWISIP